MHRLQVPLDGAQGQPGLLPEGGDQADQVHSQTLLSCHHALQLRCGNAAAPAQGTVAGQVHMPSNLHRNLGQVDDLPRALDPTPGQLGATVGTLLHYMLHSLSGRHADPGKALATLLAWLLGLHRLSLAFRLQTGHTARTPGFGLPLQLGHSPLQPLNDVLLSHDDANQDIPAGGFQIDSPIHHPYMT